MIAGMIAGTAWAQVSSLVGHAALAPGLLTIALTFVRRQRHG